MPAVLEVGGNALFATAPCVVVTAAGLIPDLIEAQKHILI